MSRYLVVVCVLFLCVSFFMAKVSFSETVYRYDDGTFEAQNGNGAQQLKSLVALHRYNVEANAKVITSVQVSWPSVGIQSGDPASVIVWSDPNLDGDPSDAQVLTQVDTTIDLSSFGDFVSIDVPDTLVGDSFFVGTRIEKDSTEFLAGRQEDRTPPISGQAWTADFIGRSADLNDLASANFLIRQTGRHWGIRATGVAIPEPSCFGCCAAACVILLRRIRTSAKHRRVTA